MCRWLYSVLLRLHPREFRERFGAEMLDIFEQESRAGNRAALLMDGAISAFRQRALRPAFEKPTLPAAGPAQLAPVFQTLPGGLPRRSALVNGALITVALLSVVNFAAARGGGGIRKLLIGGTYFRPSVLPVEQRPAPGNEFADRVEVGSSRVSRADETAEIYFRTVRVLRALDGDGDGVVSAPEMASASTALVRLDKDGDGTLSAQECDIRAESMHAHPVLSALDADGNGTISRHEIQTAPTLLKAIDADGDGTLTAAEVRP